MDGSLCGSGLMPKKVQEGDDRHNERDPELWHDDGTIALIAGHVEFRVYKGTLAANSTVFADMFAFPQASKNAESCPVVHVTDSPEDLRHVLRVLFPNKDSQLIPDELATLTFNMVSAFVRLGDKYQIEHLIRQTLNFLKRHFTNDFDLWPSRSATASLVDGWKAVHAIGVVNLARLAECDAILPAAMLQCCRLTSAELLDGFLREDGTRETLSREDLVRCLDAQKSYVRHMAAMCQAINKLSVHPPSCLSLEVCRPAWPAYIQYRQIAWFNVDDPFRNFNAEFDWDAPHFGLCIGCIEWVKSRLVIEQRKLWERRREIVGLAPESSS